MKSRMREICTYGSVRGKQTVTPYEDIRIRKGGCRDLSTRRTYYEIYTLDINDFSDSRNDGMSAR